MILIIITRHLSVVLIDTTCFTISGGNTRNGTKIHLWDILPKGREAYGNQVWLFEKGLIKPKRVPHKSLHLSGGNTGDGTSLHIWDSLREGHCGYLNQEWEFLRSSEPIMSNICFQVAGKRTATFS